MTESESTQAASIRARSRSIEKLSASVIPSALVRTDKGTRQVRTIDLTPVKAEPEAAKIEAPKAEPAATEDAPPA